MNLEKGRNRSQMLEPPVRAVMYRIWSTAPAYMHAFWLAARLGQGRRPSRPDWRGGKTGRNAPFCHGPGLLIALSLIPASR